MTEHPEWLEIPHELWIQMQDHLIANLPEEACGLVGGIYRGASAVAMVVKTVDNVLHSPVRFRMDPLEQIKAFHSFEESGYELLAIFHSHPAGPGVPSATDLEEFAYPGTLVMICCPDAAAPGSWQFRAFHIDGVLSAQSPFEPVTVVRIEEAQP